MGRVGIRLTAALAGALGTLALPGLAAGVTNCTVGTTPADPTPTMVVSHESGSGTVLLRVVRVQGSASPVIVVSDGGAAVACTGSSTATDAVGFIRYFHAGGTAGLVIEEPRAFSPGVVSEGVSPQIKMLVRQDGGTLSGVVLRDTDGSAERMNLGFIPGATNLALLDVNPEVDPADPDIGIDGGVSGPLTIEGGPGADVVVASGDSTRLPPYTRPLILIGGEGPDSLTGGGGNDVIRPGGGADAVDASGGFDRVDYSDATSGVDVDLARAGPQAGGAAGDALAGVEDLTGSPAADVLRGDTAANALDGAGADDVIEGRGGNDLLTGGPGADVASYAAATAPVTVDAALTTPQQTGGAGLDTFTEPVEGLTGGAAADVLRGTEGPDLIEGGPGADAITALGGADRLRLVDGAADTADCGAGADQAEVDPGAIDALTACETVTVGVVPPPPPGPPAGGGAVTTTPARLSALLGGPARQALVRGAVTLTVRCPVLACAARASGFATLGTGRAARRIVLTRAAARIAAGSSRALRLVVPVARRPALRSALRAGRRVVVSATVVVSDPAASATPTTLRRTITLKR